MNKLGDMVWPAGADSQYLHLADVRIHYRMWGEGPLLLLLHGLGSSGADWLPVVADLQAHFRLLLMDLRGFGSSSLARSRDYSIAAMANDVIALLEHCGHAPAHVVGLSLGGCVALQLAILAPHMIDHLVLVNTFAKLQAGGWRSFLPKLRRLWAARDIDTLAAFVAREHFTDPELQALAYSRLRQNDLGVLHRTMWAIARLNLLPALPHITHPTLLLIGDRDRTVPPVCARDLQAGIPHARTQIIADAGHALPYDQPDAFSSALLSFLGAASRNPPA